MKWLWVQVNSKVKEASKSELQGEGRVNRARCDSLRFLIDKLPDLPLLRNELSSNF